MIEQILFLILIPFAYAYDYEEPLINGIPTVCTVPPDDPLISEQIKKNYLRETKNAILEWQYKIQSIAKKPENWKINYLENGKNCDIIIEFKRHYDETAIPDYYDVLGSYYDGKIELYFQEFSTCGEQGETRCYYDDVITSRAMSVTAKHEFGHALGLGHSEGRYDATGKAVSIMNAETDRLNDSNQITDRDIQAIIRIYGNDGFDNYNGKITPWVRNNAELYSSNVISKKEFGDSIRHLINIEIIKFVQINNVDVIPDWFRNVSGWWTDKQITDDEFLNSLRYLLAHRIIRV